MQGYVSIISEKIIEVTSNFLFEKNYGGQKMAGVNKAILIGNLGRDPEIRYTQDGRAVVNFSLATSFEWKDKGTGEKREKTEWHRIVVFGKLGEICGEYLTKGKQVYIEGRLQTRSWEQEGVTKYTTEIIAENMRMLGSKGDSGSAPDHSSDPQNASNFASEQKTESSMQETPMPGKSMQDNFDDEIPF
jgi:single-strand DNA-binding protein